MGFRNKSGNTYLAILLFTVGMPVMAQDKVGQVLEDSDTGFVIRNDKTPADIGFPENVLLNDVLGVKGRGDELMISFEAAYNTSGAARSSGKKKRTEITIFYGDVRLASKDVGVLDIKLDDGGVHIECVLEAGSSALFSGPPHLCPPRTENTKDINSDTTLYQVDVSVSDTRISVFEGIVSVTSTNPDFPDARLVHAGEWVRARKGEEIPPPQRFTMASGPGSGSTECIYSDCKLVNSVLIPARPVVTPAALVPPPPNPPGQR